MASALQNFVQAASDKAFSIIGTESITIDGGSPISGILNEAGQNTNYEEGGFEPSASFEFVIDQLAFSAVYPLAAKSYLKAIVVARGENWRISSIRAGQKTAGQFVIISLVSPNKSS